MQALVLTGDWAPRADYEPAEDEIERQRAMDCSQAWRNPSLVVRDRERPTPRGDEVLVAVRYAGICGSDLSLIETDDAGYVHYSAYGALPNVIGHEFSGEVVEVGDRVNRLDIGDFVTAEVTDYCGRCDNCRQGFPGQCMDFEQIGFTEPGAIAEFVCVPEKLLWDISSLLDTYDSESAALKAAATIEPTTISYHGLFERATGVLPGDYFVFHGLGPIGLTGMNLVRAAGAGVVIGFEPKEGRREVAQELGFDHVYDPTAVDAIDTIEQTTDGAGADLHVETAGAVRATYPLITDTLAEGANIVHVSNAGAPAPLETRQLQGHAAQVYGTEGHSGSRAYPRVIRLMTAGRLDNLPMVTSTFRLSDAQSAFDRALERVGGKVLIEI